MSELTMLALPEQIAEEEKYVIATYYLETAVETDIVKKVSAIAVEQTTGTWVPVPEETPEMREKHVAKVVGIYEVPGHEFEVPYDLEARHFIFQLAYPAVNFGAQIPMLLSTVIGNISMSGKLKLLDLQFPKNFLESFQGPKFGTQGVRDLLGIPERPLLNNMIKPCTGYTPEVGAKLFSNAIRGGVDMVRSPMMLVFSLIFSFRIHAGLSLIF
ncbi:MAG: ribulose 1,5-bisphosphate carboxylase, partial [Syntrophaceticus schinkii]|nr:ribulose 1,5-bisphosphate carboxylase [Syntrophaceticus schinkii]